MHHVQEWSQQSPTLSKLGLYNSPFNLIIIQEVAEMGWIPFGGQLHSETKLLHCKMYEQELIRKVVHF